MPHHINIRKKRQSEKAMLVGKNSCSQLYQAVVAQYSDGDGYLRTEISSGRTEPIGTKIDIYDKIKYKSLIIERNNAKSATREARRHGSLVSCYKVEPEYYLHKIEFMKIEKHAPVMEIIDMTVTVNKTLEAQKVAEKKIFTVEIVDK